MCPPRGIPDAKSELLDTSIQRGSTSNAARQVGSAASRASAAVARTLRHCRVRRHTHEQSLAICNRGLSQREPVGHRWIRIRRRSDLLLTLVLQDPVGGCDARLGMRAE